MYISGIDTAGADRTRRHWIIARQAHGPNIPCIPVILIARRLARGRAIETGARPCLDLISLDEYVASFEGLDVTVLSDLQQGT